MNEIVDLAHKKRLAESSAEKDCRKCLPIDILIELLEDIKSGKVDPDKMIISYSNLDKNEGGFRMAGLTRYEAVGLMHETQYYLAK